MEQRGDGEAGRRWYGGGMEVRSRVSSRDEILKRRKEGGEGLWE